MTDRVLVEAGDDGVVRVRLARPAARNAVDLSMCQELETAFRSLDADPTVRVVAITGDGPVFCAGADLKERTGRDAAWVRARRRVSFAAYDAIARCAAPVVSFVHGSVVGSGGEIAMASDFVVAQAGTTFRFPEAHWGTVGATQRLQRAVGVRRAKQLLLTNRPVGTDEAQAWGLVQDVTDDLDATREQVCQAIAGAPPLSIRLTKQAVDLGAETDLARGIGIEMAAIERCLADTGWQDGVARFTERPRTTDGGPR